MYDISIHNKILSTSLIYNLSVIAKTSIQTPRAIHINCHHSAPSLFPYTLGNILVLSRTTFSFHTITLLLADHNDITWQRPCKYKFKSGIRINMEATITKKNPVDVGQPKRARSTVSLLNMWRQKQVVFQNLQLSWTCNL